MVTPELRGTILAGITRESVITLLRDRGIAVEERRIAIDEILAGIDNGSLQEAFGAGTAAIISPVGRMSYEGREWLVNNNQPGPITLDMYDAITGIQLGEVEDRHGWTHRIDIDGGQEKADDLGANATEQASAAWIAQGRSA